LDEFTLGDNRAYILLAAKRLVPNEPLRFIRNLALSYHSFLAARREFERRITRQKVHTLLFLNLLWVERPRGQSALQPLLHEIRPHDWIDLARGLGEPEPKSLEAKQEIDARVAARVAELLAKYRSSDTDDVFLSVIKGDIHYLPKQARNRVLTDYRKASAKKRRPDVLVSLESVPGFESMMDGSIFDLAGEPNEDERRLDIDETELADLSLRIQASEEALTAAGCGPRAGEILRCYAGALVGGKRPTQEEMASRLGMSDRHLRNYLEQLRTNAPIVLRAIRGEEIT
jgi:hypothetical protein